VQATKWSLSALRRIQDAAFFRASFSRMRQFAAASHSIASKTPQLSTQEPLCMRHCAIASHSVLSIVLQFSTQLLLCTWQCGTLAQSEIGIMLQSSTQNPSLK
jgi:hypothetical protein